MPIPFRQIDFGASDANNEARDNSELLLGGYLDLHDAFTTSVHGPQFLVLGRKGSGKTALAQHVLLSAEDMNTTARYHKLENLPFKNFPLTIGEQETWQTAYPAFWRYHLTLQILNDLRDDPNFPRPQNDDLRRIVDALEAAGELPARDLASAIRHSANLPAATSRAGEVSFFDLTNRMTDAIAGFEASRKRVVLIDGLDEIHAPKELELQVLDALISAVSSLNNIFFRAPCSTKIMVLIRSDLFDRMPGANTEKYRQDRSIELDWYQHTLEPTRSHLAQLVNLKARVSDPSIKNLMDEYFPARTRGLATLQYLLDHTRHTPRDLLRVFRNIQRFAASETPGISYAEINQGLRKYSDYFAGEVRNEMSGYGTDQDIGYVFSLLRRQGRANFRIDDLVRLQASDRNEIDLLPLLRRLFDCGGIGMVDHTDGNTPRYTFRYRNPNAEFDAGAMLRIHLGWRRELSVRIREDEERQVMRSARTKAALASEQLPLPLNRSAADNQNDGRPTRGARSEARSSNRERTRTRAGIPIITAPVRATELPAEGTRPRRRATRPQGPPPVVPGQDRE